MMENSELNYLDS